MISDTLALQIANGAKAAGISETGMLSLVEVETSGVPFEHDGETPTFLFERHKFYAELKAHKPDLLKTAVSQGLAHADWRPKEQYRDERTSAQRMELLNRAKAIDEDSSLRACSWGLPQIMGSEAEEIGFDSAADMIHAMSSHGIAGQVSCMAKFLHARRLESALDREDWAYVALRYNGRGYAKNHYDTRLAAASVKWVRKLPTLREQGAQEWPENHLSQPQIEKLQRQLRTAGYHEVGEVDGRWGDRTSGAIFNFQKHEGLPATGHLDDATMTALADPNPRLPSETRATATEQDLRDQGSRTIRQADNANTVGKVKVAVGAATTATTIGGAILENSQSTIDTANEAIDKVHQVKGLWASIHDLVPLSPHAAALVAVAIAVMVGGYFVIRYAKGIRASRLEDYQSGVHAGIARN